MPPSNVRHFPVFTFFSWWKPLPVTSLILQVRDGSLSIALLDGAKELKVLGNDAAHVIAKEYASIGREEAALSIEVAKEILKALYQHKGLVERLQKLRNAGPTP